MIDPGGDPYSTSNGRAGVAEPHSHVLHASGSMSPSVLTAALWVHALRGAALLALWLTFVICLTVELGGRIVLGLTIGSGVAFLAVLGQSAEETDDDDS